jgi:hypothetical protein
LESDNRSSVNWGKGCNSCRLPSETSNGSDVVTPQPRKARVVKPSTPASKLAMAAGPPSL